MVILIEKLDDLIVAHLRIGCSCPRGWKPLSPPFSTTRR